MERIAFLCLSDGWGGLEMNQLRSAQQMQARGHRVLLITNANSRMAFEAKAIGMPIYIVRQKAQHYQWRFAWKLCRYLKRENCTQLIFRNNREQSIAASVAFFSSNKIKVHYFMEMALGGRRTQFFRSLRYHFFSTWVCPLPYLKKQVEASTRIERHKIKEIPSGVGFNTHSGLDQRIARQLLGWPLDAKIFVMPGRIDAKKRQLFVWECFSNRPNADEYLIFVGERTLDESDQYAQTLQKAIQNHPKRKQVIWAGFQTEMTPIYMAADLIIMAADFETVGMATLEAMQHNCPVVGAQNGGTEEIIRLFGGGLCFEAKNNSSLNKCIDVVLNEDSPALNKVAFQQHFDFNRVCEQIEKEVLGWPAPIFQ